MNWLIQLWQHHDLRRRLLVTFALLLVFRFLVHLPVPGVNLERLAEFLARNQFLGLLDLFTGGSLGNLSIAMMGVAPYITAAIIMQLMTMAIPQVEALSKEGEFGRRKINQFTRYLTVPLAVLQAYGTLRMIQTSEFQILSLDSLGKWAALLTITTAGTILLMWLGELMTEFGIGNGISVLIFAGIIARLPSLLGGALVLADVQKVLGLVAFAALALLITFFVVYISEGERKIPVSYGGRASGSRLFLAGTTYLPLRVNQAGVIPIIFALSLLLFPGIIASFFATARSVWLAEGARFVQELFKNNTFYGTLYFLLVALFTYFYTWVVFNPERIADHLHKQGGFIPGIRPGRQTVNFLSFLTNRLTLAGAIFLGLIAVLPFIVQAIFRLPNLTIGGTSLLIVVSVALEVMRQVRSMLLTKRYHV